MVDGRAGEAPATRVLDADPDLRGSLSGQRLEQARLRLTARIRHTPAGPWCGPRDADVLPFGLLVLDGVMARELLMEDNVSAELIGAGDVIRPAGGDSPSRLLRAEVRWTVLEPARLAVLGRGFAIAAAPYPEVNAALLDRVTMRAHRLALTQAITQLNGVDRRVLSLFWLLAERWGRVTNDGVVVPLALPHRVVAHLVGARRPTVSTAIGQLVADGRLTRRPNGTWVLRGDPVGTPTEATARVVRLRRRTAQLVAD